METRKKQSAENCIKDIRRKTRRLFSSEQKIQIIMDMEDVTDIIVSIEERMKS